MSRNPGTWKLPHDLDAERSLLGAILVHNLAYEQVARTLAVGDFYRDSHQRIYAAMVTLLDDLRTPVDEVTLKNELDRRGDLAECGGPRIIAELANGVPDGTNAIHYASIVKEKAQLRRLIAAGNALTKAAYEAQAPSAELIAAADRSLLDLSHGHANGRMASLASSSGALFEDLAYRMEHRGELSGVDTGFKSLNELTSGWQAGDLIIVAAGTSIGKTTFTLNSAVHAALTCRRHSDVKRRIAYFSLEMRRRQLEYRIMSQLSGIPLTRFTEGNIRTAEHALVARTQEQLHGMKIEIDDRAGQSSHEIRAACRRMKRDGGLDLVVVDYIQLMPGTLDAKANRNEQLTDTGRRLKDLADEASVPVIVLSQLRRHEGRPKLDDLRESGSLEQATDICILLYRKDHRESGTTECILAKQRNGSTGTVNLTLDRDTTTFSDGGADVAEESKSERPARQGYFASRQKATGW